MLVLGEASMSFSFSYYMLLLVDVIDYSHAEFIFHTLGTEIVFVGIQNVY